MRVRCTATAVLTGMTLIPCCSVVTTEEIRWLQSGVVVPRVTHPPRGGAGTFVGRRDANVVRWTVICAHVVLWIFVDILRLWAPAQEGYEVSLAARGATRVAPEVLDVSSPLLFH